MELVCLALGAFVVGILASVLYWLVVRDQVMAGFQEAREDCFAHEEIDAYGPGIDEMYVDGNGKP